MTVAYPFPLILPFSTEDSHHDQHFGDGDFAVEATALFGRKVNTSGAKAHVFGS